MDILEYVAIGTVCALIGAMITVGIIFCGAIKSEENNE